MAGIGIPITAAALAYYYYPPAAFASNTAKSVATALSSAAGPVAQSWYQGLSSSVRSALIASLAAASPPVFTPQYKTNLTPVNLRVLGFQVQTTVNGVPKNVYTNGKRYYANMNNKTYEVTTRNIASGKFTRGGTIIKRVELANNKPTTVNGRNVNVFTPDNGKTFVANMNGQTWSLQLMNKLRGVFVKSAPAALILAQALQQYPAPYLGPAYRTRTGGAAARGHLPLIYRLAQQ